MLFVRNHNNTSGYVSKKRVFFNSLKKSSKLPFKAKGDKQRYSMLDWLSSDNVILLFQMLYIITALGVIVLIVTENRNPVKTLSWVLILLFLPLIGLIIYYFFGEDGRKQRIISHRIFRKLNPEVSKFQDVSGYTQFPQEHDALAHLLLHLDNSPVFPDSKVTFYSDGKSKMDALIEEVEKARSSIHVQYYIFMDDETGRLFRDLLVKKCREGVKVRLLYDDVGSWKAKRSFFDDMAKEGIEVQPFLKVAFRFLTSRVNYRNHRKIVVVDGKVGFVGGMNIADRYVKGVDFGIWRDSHIKVEGKAVAGLQTSFIIDWHYARKELLTDDIYYPELDKVGENLVQYATSGPIGQYKSIHMGIIHAIYNAQKSVFIQTPYFIPTDILNIAIQSAAKRGVDVRLMIPRKSDTTFVNVATRSFLQDILDAGVQIYMFEPGFLHSKMLVIDDSLTITGSANMDVRSFEHNFEINAFIYCEDTALLARSIFEKDQTMSTLLDAEEWASRSKIDKWKESFVRLFSPLL